MHCPESQRGQPPPTADACSSRGQLTLTILLTQGLISPLLTQTREENICDICYLACQLHLCFLPQEVLHQKSMATFGQWPAEQLKGSELHHQGLGLGSVVSVHRRGLEPHKHSVLCLTWKPRRKPGLFVWSNFCIVIKSYFKLVVSVSEVWVPDFT